MGGWFRSAAPAAIAWMIAGTVSAQASSELAAPDEEEASPTPGPSGEIQADLAPPNLAPPNLDARREPEIPPAPNLELDRTRLRALFEDRAADEAGGQSVAGFVSLGLGALELGAGLWLALDDGTFASLDSTRWTAAALAIPLGALALASGIAAFTLTGPQTDRLARWRLAMDGQLDARTLGRFEGELRAEAETARVLRGFEAATSFGVAGGGALLMLVTALSSADLEGQLYGYGVGGLFSLAGIISGVAALLIQSDAEDTWEAYVGGEQRPPTPSGVDLTVSPSVSEEGFGLTVQGRF